jgi:hypothetical protein
MLRPFDLFLKDAEGKAIWLEVVATIGDGACSKQGMRVTGEYIIFSQKTRSQTICQGPYCGGEACDFS